MRKFLLIISVACLLPLAAQAQETPKAEVFGGYSYLRADGDGESTNVNGWNGSVAVSANKWLSFVSDFSGHYKSFDDGLGSNVDINSHSFLFGPRVSARGEKVTPFAHALFGGLRSSAGTSGLSFNDSSFAMALGGGLDVKVSNRVAIRVAQADYFMTRVLGDTQNNLRISTGLVFRLGSR
jgi:opacity protein-like surface antigen